MLLLLPPSRTTRDGAAAAPVHPPLEHYTGTLFKAIDPASLTRAQRTWADERILIHSAEHGLVRSDRWEAPAPLLDLVAVDGAVLDLRSKDYARRDPVPADGWTVRVVSEGDDGRRLAVSHWNKLHKGLLVGALVRHRPKTATVPGIIRWANRAGFQLERVAEGQLDLVV